MPVAAFYELTGEPSAGKTTLATLISKDPASFGFGDVVPEEPASYELVTVPTPTDLEILARANYGEDLMGKEVQLPPELDYLR